MNWRYRSTSSSSGPAGRNRGWSRSAMMRSPRISRKKTTAKTAVGRALARPRTMPPRRSGDGVVVVGDDVEPEPVEVVPPTEAVVEPEPVEPDPVEPAPVVPEPVVPEVGEDVGSVAGIVAAGGVTVPD